MLVDGKLSKQGKLTALLLSSNEIELWDNQTKQQIASWGDNNLAADSYLLHLSQSGEYILSANPKVIQIWKHDIKNSLGTLDLTSKLGDAKITQISFLHTPNKFIIGASSGDIFFADIQNNDYRVNRSHSGEVTKLLVTDNIEYLYSAGNDGLVVKWDLAQYKPIISKKLPFRITSLGLGDINTVFISDALNEHIIWDSAQDNVIGQLSYRTQFKWFRQAVLDPKHKWLLTSSPKTQISLWETQDMSVLATWDAEAHSLGSAIEDMVIMKDARLRTLSSDGVLQDWDFLKLVEARNN